MNPENVFEAFCAFPAVFIETFIEGWHHILGIEADLMLHGEYDEEDIEATIDASYSSLPAADPTVDTFSDLPLPSANT
jgi:hypothetical protein